MEMKLTYIIHANNNAYKLLCANHIRCSISEMLDVLRHKCVRIRVARWLMHDCVSVCLCMSVFDVLEYGFEELHRMNMNEMKSIINCSFTLSSSWNRSLRVYVFSIDWMDVDFSFDSNNTFSSHPNSAIELYFPRWIVSISITNELVEKAKKKKKKKIETKNTVEYGKGARCDEQANLAHVK